MKAFIFGGTGPTGIPLSQVDERTWLGKAPVLSNRK
jgi:hypothetical protein